ncbi:uncharacterized protein [Diadema antillarum]|uniref:uncharacterized protein n=1 Tax=Diadema antillarum TaxID=105358 RepID=UPI003A88D4AC
MSQLSGRELDVKIHRRHYRLEPDIDLFHFGEYSDVGGPVNFTDSSFKPSGFLVNDVDLFVFKMVPRVLQVLITVNKDGTLCSSVYRKPTHTDQYLLFDSHHPLIHKLGVVRTLFHRASYLPSSEETKEKEHQHLRTVLKNCGYKHWSIEKALHPRKRDVRDRASSSTTQQRGRGVSVPYCQGLSEKIQRIFSFYRIPVYFKPTNTLRQRLVHPKDKIPKHKRNNVIYRIKCQGKDCKENYIGETKQPLHKHLYQHRRSSSAGNESAVFTHLKNTGHHFEDKEVDIIDKETRWFERGVR